MKINEKGRLHAPRSQENAGIDQQLCQNQRQKAENPYRQHLGGQNPPPFDGIGKHQIHGLILICAYDKGGQHNARKNQKGHARKELDGRGNHVHSIRRVQRAVRVLRNPPERQRKDKQTQKRCQNKSPQHIPPNIVFLPLKPYQL